MFTFDVADIAKASGFTREWVMKCINAGTFDPTDLGSLARWAGRSEDSDVFTGHLYDHLRVASRARRWPASALTSALDGFAELGFKGASASTLPRHIDLLGDQLSIGSAMRVLEHMRAKGLSEISRGQVRAVLQGKAKPPVRSVRAARIAAQLRDALGLTDQIRARGWDLIVAGGVLIPCERAQAFIRTLTTTKGRKRARLRAALLGIIDHQQAAAAEAQDVRAATKRRRLARLTPRKPAEPVTAAGTS